MSASKQVTPKPLRECVWCKHPISEWRNLVLLVASGGEIVGPFHAGCAERVRLHAAKNPTHNWLEGAAQYGRIPEAREETLPW